MVTNMLLRLAEILLVCGAGMVVTPDANATFLVPEHNGLWVGVSAGQTLTDDGALLAYVGRDGSFQCVGRLNEQGAWSADLTRRGLVVPGVDATDSWAFGNLYTVSRRGEFLKWRTVPDAIHLFGGTSLGRGRSESYIVAASGVSGAWLAETYDFVTWATVDVGPFPQPYLHLPARRYYDVLEHDGLWVVVEDMGGFAYLWKPELGIVGPPYWINKHSQLRIWKDQVVAIDAGSDDLVFIYSDGSWTYGYIPFWPLLGWPNGIGVSDNEMSMAVIASNHDIWLLDTKGTWTLLGNVPGAVSVAWWQQQGVWVVGTNEAHGAEEASLVTIQ